VYQEASSSSDEEEPLDIWDFETSDTLLVAKHLESILLEEEQSHQQQKIAQALSQFYNAEFAFLILTPKMVYYGRDAWGRRSLLRRDCPSCGSFQIVSIPEVTEEHEEQQWTEVLPGKVHQTSLLSTVGNEQPRQPASIPFPTLESPLVISPLPSVPPPDGVSDELWTASLELEFHLSRAVQMRMDHHSSCCGSTAVLFSGGLDSATQYCSSQQEKLILYNVSFGPSHDKSADRQAALRTFEVWRERYDDNVEFRDIVGEWQDICQHEPHIRTLLQPKTTLMERHSGLLAEVVVNFPLLKRRIRVNLLASCFWEWGPMNKWEAMVVIARRTNEVDGTNSKSN
jgi:asparagine synthetase B (glutamine-hydrolysing)